MSSRALHASIDADQRLDNYANLGSSAFNESSLASFLPPSTTLRAYQRRMMSTTVAEIGSVYCSIVSFANTQGTYDMDRSAIVQSLIAIRLKLKRSLVLRTNIVYEVSRPPFRPMEPSS